MRDAYEWDESPEKAVERLMETYGNAILRLCCLCLRDEGMAQDAAQEVFIKVFRHYKNFRHESSELTWLNRIAVRTCQDMRRTSWFRMVDRRMRVEEARLSAPEKDEGYGDVTDAVMALDIKYRLPILLHYYQNMPVKQVADTLHLPVNTILSRLKRGRERVKKTLEEGGVAL